MREMQDALEATFRKLPDRLLKEFIAAKLKAAGCESPEYVAALAKHLRADNAGKFEWQGDDLPDDLVLGFTEKDEAALKKQIDAVLEVLPERIAEAVDGSAKSLLRGLKRKWPAEYALQRQDEQAFRTRLERRWGRALQPLRMILTIIRECAGEALNETPLVELTPRRRVLFQLHIRGCQIASEIIALMEGGFADGAMARWRTLYELNTVAAVIFEAEDDTAEKYLAHEVVELWAQALEFQQHHIELGYDAIPSEEMEKKEQTYRAALARYGEAFRLQYGWAADFLQLKKPTFKDLEKAAGRTHIRPYFQMASYNVHATSRALTFRLGLFGGGGFLAGASNAGLSDPALNTARTLVQFTALLMQDPPTVDDLVPLKVIAALSDEMPKLLFKAEKKLRRDEDRVRSAITKKRKGSESFSRK